jgi:hypothetical protein
MVLLAFKQQPNSIDKGTTPEIQSAVATSRGAAWLSGTFHFGDSDKNMLRNGLHGSQVFKIQSLILLSVLMVSGEKGAPLELALLDAGIVRLRPVMITVGATILALFPLTMHGGPLWQPLCYAQIGGLGVAAFITLLLVPVLYSIFVLDLKIVKWEGPLEGAKEGESNSPKGELH